MPFDIQIFFSNPYQIPILKMNSKSSRFIKEYFLKKDYKQNSEKKKPKPIPLYKKIYIIITTVIQTSSHIFLITT